MNRNLFAGRWVLPALVEQVWGAVVMASGTGQ